MLTSTTTLRPGTTTTSSASWPSSLKGGTYDDPVSGPLEGAELEGYYAETLTGLPDLEFNGHVYQTKEDGVLVNQWTGTGTQSGSYFGLPPTGRPLTIEGVSVFRIADDGITEIKCYYDRRAVQEQLGLSFPEIIGQLPKLAYGRLSGASSRG